MPLARVARCEYASPVSFRDRLLATLRAVRLVLEEPGVLVVGSEVPNLLEKGAEDEPSVWLPETDNLIEVNFIGMDPNGEPGEAYVLEDDELPLLVFGALSLVSEGPPVEVEGMRIPLPRRAGLILEKLVTERTGEKGQRDILVALGLLMSAGEDDLEELDENYAALAPVHRHAVQSNLTVLSLMNGVGGMPDPASQRHRVADLLARLEAVEEREP